MLMAKLCYVEGEYRDALGNPHTPLVLFIHSYLVFVHGMIFINQKSACMYKIID